MVKDMVWKPKGYKAGRIDRYCVLSAKGYSHNYIMKRLVDEGF